MGKITEIIKELSKSKDQIPGGKGDKTKVSSLDPEMLKIGTKVEMEHTKDPKKAKEIAIDHLTINPKYYADGGKEAGKDLGKDIAEAKKDIKKCGDMIEAKMKKSITTLDDQMEDYLCKGKKFPVGTIHNGMKKVAEGEWVPEEKAHAEKKAEAKKEEKEQMSEDPIKRLKEIKERDKKVAKERAKAAADEKKLEAGKLLTTKKTKEQPTEEDRKRAEKIAGEIKKESQKKKERPAEGTTDGKLKPISKILEGDKNVQDVKKMADKKEYQKQISDTIKTVLKSTMMSEEEKIKDLQWLFERYNPEEKIKKSFDEFMCEEIERLVK